MAFGDFTVVRSTVKRVLNSSGVLAEVAINTPAFEFNTDGTYRGLLVEPAGTNLLVRSSEFNTTWAKSDITVTDNSIASPDGAVTADTITEGSAGTASTGQGITVSSGVTATFSTFLKYSNLQWLRIRFSDGANAVNSWVDIQNGVAGSISAAGTGVVGTVRVENYGNGWYRCSVSGSIPASTSYTYSFFSATANASFTRVNNSVYYAWGAQAETGSVATSYIPTVASTQTRTADSVTLTGASSLIGQTEGTLYVEVDIPNFTQANARGILYLSDGTTNNRIALQVAGANDEVQLISSTSGVTLVVIQTNNNPSGIVRYSGGYALNDFVLYANGSQIGADASATVPACSQINIGSVPGGTLQFQGWIRSVVLFPTRLTNAQLQALTA